MNELTTSANGKVNGETVGELDYVLAPDEVSTSKVRRLALVLATFV